MLDVDTFLTALYAIVDDFYKDMWRNVIHGKDEVLRLKRLV